MGAPERTQIRRATNASRGNNTPQKAGLLVLDWNASASLMSCPLVGLPG